MQQLKVEHKKIKSTNSNQKIVSNEEKIVELLRIQLEEDPAKLVYLGSIDSSPYTLVDYNRAGIAVEDWKRSRKTQTDRTEKCVRLFSSIVC